MIDLDEKKMGYSDVSSVFTSMTVNRHQQFFFKRSEIMPPAPVM